MRVKQLLWLLLLCLIAVAPAKADSTYVYVNGSYPFASDGFAVGPYGGTLGGSPAEFFCIDFKDQITGNSGWNANVTSLTSPTGYGQTLLKSQTTYLEMAWLVTQMLDTPTTLPKTQYQTLEAEYQWAIWALSVGDKTFYDGVNLDPFGTDGNLIQLASNNVSGGWKVSGWEIVTPTGGYGQEFLVDQPPSAAIPEPSTVILLVSGSLAFVFLSRRK